MVYLYLTKRQLKAEEHYVVFYAMFSSSVSCDFTIIGYSYSISLNDDNQEESFQIMPFRITAAYFSETEMILL